MMKKQRLPISEIIFLLLGELLVSFVMIGVYMTLDQYSYRVATGAALGSAVTIFNFLFLSISVNRAVDKIMEMRGDKEMTEEEAQKFAAENQAAVQSAVRVSYLVRQVVLLAVLVLAFLSKRFDVLATLIPLLMFRPLLYVHEFFKKKGRG